ncbi:MAG TPA: hypothetical protein VKC56_02460 [Gallionellaceae bacterium]|nr:hypothetical protein [Gallionellaceae bacterium]
MKIQDGAVLNHFVLLLSAALFIGILSPILVLYVLAIIVYVGVINPLAHVYRIFRYGIEYDPVESFEAGQPL